ncbi:xanthine dehydrogenase family protein molybdopterin-binding subunit [Rhodoplanes sp. Z2-YC6860]|uniref:xanthine dehydrogenase family protein molybdopterin-binding subunit n=1 Tax=Rhodoplanes sp. Z2-YC6860 TaxID=674703 RepID=UPI00078D87AD|nr:molybdopterin cofactor-binding domain-containing protein [Rhodoplanes sp. Z2-YC6860]AMN41949.1 aldehyde oxidase and xanthine dehydrogenase molybdopterin-binding protein [Rhodoplanes sp. Z2-YC6860]
MNAPVLSRRSFAKGVGGIALAFSLDPTELLAQGTAERLPGSLQTNRRLEAWLRINPDGTATVITGKVELGQGILTALKQIAAEELDLPLDRLTMISGDTGRTPDEGQTAGSQSTENSGTALRLASAEVRAMLLDLAAQKLGAPADTLKVSDGVISTADGRKITYGEIAGSLDLKREATAKFKPKDPSTHKIVGQSIERIDIPAKVTGGAAYVQDMRPAGMVHGRVVRPPRYGSKLASVDETSVKLLPGVIAVVRDGSFLGVVAEREEQAIKAREALAKAAKWTLGPELPDQASIHAHLKSLPNTMSELGVKQAPVLAAAGKTLEATYTKPYLAHASIGPSAALAEFKDGKLTVWTHSQGVFPLRAELTSILKMPRENIRCVHVEGSGCYGQNGADDVALDAALLARAAGGRPVRLQWMRDDEFGWEPYGAAMSMSVRASLDADNKIADWHYELWSNTHSMRPESTKGANVLAAWYLAEPQPHGPPQGIPQPAGGGDRNAIPLYDFPNQKIVHHFIPEMPIRVSALRTLGAYANVFALESFMDEMAALAAADPVAFRLAHLKDPRAKAVIEKVAAMANWKAGEAGSLARGRGIGFAKYKNLACYVACIAEVEVDKTNGKVRVPQVWAAVDSGLVINPDGLKNQMEGGIIQSTSWTLYEQVRFDKNGITSRDWASYPIMTMPEVPKVMVELINRPSERPLGSGEGSQGPAVAAIANAVANATGKRLRDLPLDAGRVKAAIG